MSSPEKPNASPFWWGVSTSAYQSEGGYNGTGQPQTNWASVEENGYVMATGRAAEFWTRYEEDFARCRAMGLNAFRLGLEWSRIQPTYENAVGSAPPFDFDVLDHYVGMIASCRRHGLEPVVTLHHFVHPAWLGLDPWLNPESVEYFTAYATVTVSYINDALVQVHGLDPIGTYITINEPNMLAVNTYFGTQFPGGERAGLATVDCCYNHLLSAHVRAYNLIHDLYMDRGWTAPAVTLNNYASDVYWGDKFLLDLLSIRERGLVREQAGAYIRAKADQFRAALAAEDLPLKRDLPYYIGALVSNFTDWLGKLRFTAENFAPLLEAVYASPRARLFDYVAIDYYDPFVAHVFRFPVFWDHEFKNKSIRCWVMNTVASKWWDWHVLPQGLHFFCSYYSQDFARPVLIAENGMAHRCRPDNQHTRRTDRITRSEFLRLHVEEVVKIVEEGIPLMGYLHWSLVDNYEWGTFTPRFGLFSLDYTQGTDRLVQDPQGDRPSETYTALVREAREKMAKSTLPG